MDFTMDAVLVVLRSIDFWTIIGSVGSIAAVVIAIYSISRYNRKSKSQARREEISLMAKSIEDRTTELMVNYKIEGGKWEQYARSQPASWVSTVPEFEHHLKKTMDCHRRVAEAIGTLNQQPELTRSFYQSLAASSLRLGTEVDKTMTFRQESDQDLIRSLHALRDARLKL